MVQLLRLFRVVISEVIGAERAALLIKFSVFVFGGGLGWLLNIGVTLFLSRVFGLWQMLAYAIGLVCNIAFNFAFHRYITFRVNTRWHHSVIFAIITLAIVAANWLFVYIFVERLRLNLPATSFAVTVLLSFVNFAANRLFVFKGKPQ